MQNVFSEAQIVNLVNDLAGKIPKVSAPSVGNFPALAADGTLTDSGFGVGTFDTNGAAAGVQTNLNTHTAATAAHSATSANTASRIVARDGSGNFSAGTITATLSGNASSITGSIAESQVTNLVTDLAGKAAATHTHAEADVTGLVADLAAKFTRWLRSGLYYFCIPGTGTSTLNTLGNGTLRVSQFYVPRALSLSRIGGDISAIGDAGSKLRLGIYADDGTGYPGALVLDAGTIAGDSATVQEIVINQALAAGTYWVGGVVQLVTVTQPTVRVPASVQVDSGMTTIPAANQSIMGYSQSGVTGALPANFSTTVANSGATPRVFVKVA